MDSDEEKGPVNERLATLALVAEKEDAIPEPDTAEAEEQAESQKVEAKEIDKAAARNIATAIIGGMAFIVKTVWDVEYEQPTKDEGIDKLEPCLETAAMPEWLRVLFGHYWLYFVFGGFLVMTGVSTYAIVQKRKQDKQEKGENGVSDEVEQPEPQPQWEPPAMGGGFRTSGA